MTKTNEPENEFLFFKNDSLYKCLRKNKRFVYVRKYKNILNVKKSTVVAFVSCNTYTRILKYSYQQDDSDEPPGSCREYCLKETRHSIKFLDDASNCNLKIEDIGNYTFIISFNDDKIENVLTYEDNKNPFIKDINLLTKGLNLYISITALSTPYINTPSKYYQEYRTIFRHTLLHDTPTKHKNDINLLEFLDEHPDIFIKFFNIKSFEVEYNKIKNEPQDEIGIFRSLS